MVSLVIRFPISTIQEEARAAWKKILGDRIEHFIINFLEIERSMEKKTFGDFVHVGAMSFQIWNDLDVPLIGNPQGSLGTHSDIIILCLFTNVEAKLVLLVKGV